ncbi:MAG: hypothetical protein HYS17_05825 [Micavibrio aeruginosavorus]|uniref:Uncharacterized protein n=1 Tax=Micavibrio aeruginosavorus TaxID=349221 RepID=A0A7T5UHG8_9BACT|nr:MAG: hypothetical protein HYS17_05825 [Micavibrio aeruginosavorus]
MSKLALRDRFSEWVGNSPVVGIPAGAALLGYGAVRGFVEGIKWRFDAATKPIADFDPRSPQEGPSLSDQMAVKNYRECLEWSLGVLGGGRVDKLLDRLSLTDIPHVDKKSQIWALSQSYAGIKNLPQHEQLIKYGLNDRAVLSVARGIDLAIGRTLREFSQEVPPEEWKEKPKTFIQGAFDAQGLKIASTNQIVKDRVFFLEACVKSSLESCSFHDRKDPATKDKLSKVLLDWLVEDVQAEVPDIFGEIKAPEFVSQRGRAFDIPDCWT